MAINTIVDPPQWPLPHDLLVIHGAYFMASAWFPSRQSFEKNSITDDFVSLEQRL